jgi:UDP-N-acetylglucosamine 4,6-dehydratase
LRITDLTQAMAPNLKTRVVGIRPGEKLHEVMCPADDSHLTLQFADHFVLQPTIRFHHRDSDYRLNRLGETGAPVEQGFEYNSGTNPHFLTVDEIREFNRSAGA